MRDTDEATYLETEDMRGCAPYLGLCAICLPNLNSKFPTRISPLTRGWAAELFGTRLQLPSGNTFNEWKYDLHIPPSYDWVSEIALTFGPDVRFQDSSGIPLPMFAVTIKNGTMVCAGHVSLNSA